MQQASDYPGQHPIGREYVPQPPVVSYQPPVASAASGIAARAAGDWVRWGPIWAGLITVISMLVLLSALGAAIELSIWGTNSNTTFTYGWISITGFVAYLLGGWIAGRSSGVAGRGASVLNGGLVWALSIVVLLLLLFISVLVGIASVLGGIGLPFVLTLTALGAKPQLLGGVGPQTAAWITFIALAVALVLAAFGGMVGARRGLRVR